MSETPRNKVNILAHFEAAVAVSDAKLKEAKSTLKALEKSVAANDDAHEAAVKAVKAEIEKTDKLIDTLAGEDATILATLRKKASDLQTKLKAIVSDYPNSEANVKIRESLSSARSSVEAAQDELSKAEKQRDAAKQLAEASALRALEQWKPKRGVIEAEEFDTIEDAVNAYLLGAPVVVEISPKGKVIDKVHVLHRINDESSTSDIFARPGVRYAVKDIPSDLDWLREAAESGFQDVPNRYGHFDVNGVHFDTAPTDEEIAAHGRRFSFDDGAAANSVVHRDFFVCFVKSESEFYSIRPKKFLSLELVAPARRGTDQYGRPCNIDAVTRDVEQDVSSIFLSLSKHVLAAVDESQKEFGDLVSAKSALAKRVRGAVTEVATTDTLFFPQNKRLNAAEVNADVGAYWDAFISAPWERSIDDGLAMLKHLCERKIESPHVWSNEIKGYYGLRVRTRDHTWIEAEIFCPPSALAPSQPISADSVRYQILSPREQIVKVGPCYIRVYNRYR